MCEHAWWRAQFCVWHSCHTIFTSLCSYFLFRQIRNQHEKRKRNPKLFCQMHNMSRQWRAYCRRLIASIWQKKICWKIRRKFKSPWNIIIIMKATGCYCRKDAPASKYFSCPLWMTRLCSQIVAISTVKVNISIIELLWKPVLPR